MPTRLAVLLLLTIPPTVAASDVHRPLLRPVLVHNVEALTHADALRLTNRFAPYRITKDSLAEDHDGRTVIDATRADAVHRTAWLLPLAEVPEVLTVRARLRVIAHGASWGFGELIEYRLEDAEV